MKIAPVPREEVFSLYWKFASERQAVFERRVAGHPPPWTDDEVLRRFKFCNVFRAADRVSQYLIRCVAYGDEVNDPVDRVFQIIAFRMFSEIDTWNAVRDFLGESPRVHHLRGGAFLEALEYAEASNGKLYTGAFILCANKAYGFDRKHENHVELFRHMFLHGCVGERLLSANKLVEVYQILHAFPLLGDFMSYQIAIDLNYSELFRFSENDFTQPGPGALRGLRKAFLSLGEYSPSETIQWMVDRQQKEFNERCLNFNGLWGRHLHAIDCQGLFCELDKYCREVVPDLVSNRRRIKARFRESEDSIVLFFPPKWGINGKLPEVPVFGRASSAIRDHASA